MALSAPKETQIRDIPTITLVFPYEGTPYGIFTPDEECVPQVMDWLKQAHPEFVDVLERFVIASRMRGS